MHRREPIGLRRFRCPPQPVSDRYEAAVDLARDRALPEPGVGIKDDAGRRAAQNSPPRPSVTLKPSWSCVCPAFSMFMKALESTPITEVMRLGPVPGLNAS